MSIRTVSSREVYCNRWIRVREDEVVRADGGHGIYGVVEKADGAVILPVDGDHIWLVSQYRYPVGERGLELPQGSWDAEVADAEELARGELHEETGLLAGRMTVLPWFWMAYGFVRQRQHVFIAEQLTMDAPHRDAEESDMEVIRMPISSFEEKVGNGEIRDVCTLAAWASYRLRRPEG